MKFDLFVQFYSVVLGKKISSNAFIDGMMESVVSFWSLSHFTAALILSFCFF